MVPNALINVFLRGVTLLSRFLILFALAYFLPVEDVGVYGLFVAAITYALYLLGMDFYTFANRELVGEEKAVQNWMLLSQFKLYGLAYCVFFIPLMGVFAFGFLSWTLAPFFYLILIFEHLSQEFIRLLVILERPLIANIILFVRTASWAYVLLPLFYWVPETRLLDVVFYSWCIAGATSVVMSFLLLHPVAWGGALKVAMNWSWIRRGLLASFPFLLSTLALRLMFSADRYLLEWKGGLALVGIYTFYMGICNALLAFLDASVFQFMYPKLVRSAKVASTASFFRLSKNFSGKVLGILLIGLFAISVLIAPIVEMLGKPDYLGYLNEFYWLVSAMAVLIVSYIPHYILYAKRYDRWIFLSHGTSLIVFFLVAVSLDFASAMKLIAVSLLCAFAVGLAIKSVGLMLVFRKFPRINQEGVINNV